MKKRLFLLVGNSGSGKDSVLNYAITHWDLKSPLIKVPQRYITRPPHETEPYFSVTEMEFLQMQKEGKFVFTWRSYNHNYGVPAEIKDWLNQGDIVVVNVSRDIIPEVRRLFPEVKVIFVKVPFAITTDRIEKRARENTESLEFQERLKRAQENPDYPNADIVIENSGTLEESGFALKHALLSSLN